MHIPRRNDGSTSARQNSIKGKGKMRITKPACVAIFSLFASQTVADTPVELGQLICQMTDSSNRVIRTDQTFDCVLTKTDGSKQDYTGTFKTAGIDLSVKSQVAIVWNVVLVNANASVPASIAGEYVGVSTDIAVVGGVGARVLLGTGEDEISLTPVSISGVEGGGVSLGVTRFSLSLDS